MWPCGTEAMRTKLLVAEIDFSAVGTFDNLARNFHSAIGTSGCFITDLMSALWTFDNCHI